MPTSASTGSKQVKSSGNKNAGKNDKADEKAAKPVDAEGEGEPRHSPAEKPKQVNPDHAPKAEQTPEQSKGESELNSPDGAVIKTDPDDVQPGDRADLPPMPPQEPNELADHNNSGMVHAVDQRGATVTFAVDDPDFEKKLREANPKHPSLPKRD